MSGSISGSEDKVMIKIKQVPDLTETKHPREMKDKSINTQPSIEAIEDNT